MLISEILQTFAGLLQERRAQKLILIPSESTAPLSACETIGSAFQNIYAEGYPDEEILDYPARLAHCRRGGDPRYYKDMEYADVSSHWRVGQQFDLAKNAQSFNFIHAIKFFPSLSILDFRVR